MWLSPVVGEHKIFIFSNQTKIYHLCLQPNEQKQSQLNDVQTSLATMKFELKVFFKLFITS